MKMASRRTARSLDRVGSDPAQLDKRFTRSQSDPRERKSRDVGTSSLPPIESGNVFSKGNKETAQNGPCGPGINVYGVMLGATADETILLGLQMIKKMKLTCPSIQQEPQPNYSEEVMTEDDQLQEEKHFSEEESSEDIQEEEESGDDKLENEISKTTYPSVNPSRVTQDSGIESRRGTNESTFKSMIKEENTEEEEELKDEEEPPKVESQSNTTRSDESQKGTTEDVEEEEEEEPAPIAKQESYRPSPQSSNSSKRSTSQKSSRHSQSSSQDRSTSQEVVREVQSIGRLSDTGSKQTSPKTSTKSSSSDSSPSTCIRKQDSKTSRSSSKGDSPKSSSGGSEDVKLQLSKSQKEAAKPRSSSSILKGSSSSSKSRSDPENVSCSCTCSNSTPEKGERGSSSSCSCCSCVKRKMVVCPVQKSCFKASSKVCGICAPSSNRTCYGSKSDLEMVKNCSQKKVRMCCDCSTSTSSCLACSISEKSKQMQIGDGLQGKVRYSITKITDYGEFTTFEVMKSTKKTPKTMPSSLEGVFVLRKAKSKA